MVHEHKFGLVYSVVVQEFGKTQFGHFFEISTKSRRAEMC
jgi:hypothetical protein